MENIAIHSTECKKYTGKTFLKAPDLGSPKKHMH